MAQRSTARSRPRDRSGSTAVGDGSAAVGAPVADDATDEPTGAAAGPQDAEQAPGMTAQDLAAKRRAGLDTTPAEHPPGEPADSGMPGSVIVSRQMLDEAQGNGSPARPVGPAWAGRPVVLQNQPSAPGGRLPQGSLYVIAEFGASSSTIMPGTSTPVTRKEWSPGNLVRRDVYEAVVAEHRTRIAEGRDAEPYDAQLPAGRGQLPPDVVATGPGDGPRLDAARTGTVHLSPSAGDDPAMVEATPDEAAAAADGPAVPEVPTTEPVPAPEV